MLLQISVDRLSADDGRNIVLEGPGPCPGLTRRLKIELPVGKRTAVLADDRGEEFDTTFYRIEDGVMKIADSAWAATVADPSAAKPVYNFLRRCPGGYEAPELERGDVPVWGGKDRKGRKTGPYDRLVYAVEPDKVRVIKCDYATARRLRKAVLA